MSSLWSVSSVGSQPLASSPSPPRHGTVLLMMLWTPSGVVSFSCPPRIAHTAGADDPLESVTRYLIVSHDETSPSTTVIPSERNAVRVRVTFDWKQVVGSCCAMAGVVAMHQSAA